MIVRNWRKSCPQIVHEYAVQWTIFTRRKTSTSPYSESTIPRKQKAAVACLEDLAFLEYHNLQPEGVLKEHTNANGEEIYFMVEGTGTMTVGKEKQKITDGDAIYVPQGTPHSVVNDGKNTLKYIIFATEFD